MVGRQAWADRYAYLPLWGLFVIAVWLLSEAATRISLNRASQVAISFAVLVGYSAATYTQIKYWRDGYTLFAHALEVTAANPIAEGNLGSSLMEMGRPDLAESHLERAIQLMPWDTTAHYNLGTLLHRRDELDQALREYQLTLRYGPDNREAAQTHNNLGVLFNQLGKRDQAAAEFTDAIALNPNEQNSFLGRGKIERDEGKLDTALQDFQQAAKIAASPLAYYWEGRVLEDKGEPGPAADPPGSIHITCQRIPQLLGMLGVQVDLILRAVQPEPECALGVTAVKVIDEQGLYLLSHECSIPLTDFWRTSADNPSRTSVQPYQRAHTLIITTPNGCHFLR